MASYCFFVKRSKEMKILKSLSREDLKEKFGTKEQCLSYFSNEKWVNFYTCVKCEKTKNSEGRKPLTEHVVSVDTMNLQQLILYPQS